MMAERMLKKIEHRRALFPPCGFSCRNDNVSYWFLTCILLTRAQACNKLVSGDLPSMLILLYSNYGLQNQAFPHTGVQSPS